ncbi:pif-3 [Clostera anastomosis granulovirus B]|uniref:Pif-3 n=2 Tax=Betabaculovirus TaxID=558017 RepID=A0A0K0WS42_9BBAC|nr:pif-3 [Clostera anastomosis granulovirus B]AKS25369.1 pif-3 [Clostera anastomosis granulovirus B]
MHWVWFVLILCFVLLVSVWMRRYLKHQYETTKQIRIAFERRNILDCDAVNVPCVSNDQCVDNCRGGLMMSCNSSGFCSRALQATINDPETCDANRGMIAVINALGSGGVISDSVCVSLYRDVVDDSGELREYVCDGGNMDLQLETRPFDVSDCECAPNYTKFTFVSGAFTRPTPVCVPNSLAVLYERVYAL